MSFSRMKPLPKFLILAAIVGGLGYGAHMYIKSRPQSPVAQAIEPTPVPAEGTPAADAAVQAAQAPAPTPVAAAPAADPAPAPSGLTPAGGQDAGMAAVLGAGKKK